MMVGLAAALLAGLLMVAVASSWRATSSRARLRRTEVPFATATGLAVGASLVAASTLALLHASDSRPRAWFAVFVVTTGLVAVAVGVDWAFAVRTYVGPAAVRRRVPDPRPWANHSWPTRLVLRWVPAVLLVLGGGTLIVAA